MLPNGTEIPPTPNRIQTLGIWGEKLAFYYLKKKYNVFTNNKLKFDIKKDSEWKNKFLMTEYFNPFNTLIFNKMENQLNSFFNPFKKEFFTIKDKLITKGQIDFFCKSKDIPISFYIIEVKSSDINCEKHDIRGKIGLGEKQRKYYSSLNRIVEFLHIHFLKVNFCKDCDKIFLWELNLTLK
ncbi:MAG: hypothetical protein HeimC3_34270 [Candidatus Heimdallarchaeota archaeon LC_3]|nr:MAG: hypothetical protein HeimC3_34270 [Candidatus Heimdallarchaeota archaeon LC_3]